MFTITLRTRTSTRQSVKQAKTTEVLVPDNISGDDFIAQLNELAGFRKFIYLEEDQPEGPVEAAERIVEEAATSIVEEDTVPLVEFKSLYSADVFLAPTGPLVERPDYVVPSSFDDRAIAGRHGLQRFEVENAINDGWLKR